MGTFGRKAQIKCCSLLYICNKNNELKLFSEVLQFISFYFSPKEILQFSLFCLSIFFLTVLRYIMLDLSLLSCYMMSHNRKSALLGYTSLWICQTCGICFLFFSHDFKSKWACMCWTYTHVYLIPPSTHTNTYVKTRENQLLENIWHSISINWSF